MPIQTIEIKCQFDGVASLRPAENIRWCLTLQDPNSGEQKERVYICPDEEIETESGRGLANFVMKWKDSKRQCNVSIVDVGVPGEYTANDTDFVAIIGFECRGCEIVTWHPTSDDLFLVTSENGETFEDVDLTDDWCDVEEESGTPLEITELEVQVGIAEAKVKKGGGKKKKANKKR